MVNVSPSVYFFGTDVILYIGTLLSSKDYGKAKSMLNFRENTL